MHGPLFVTDQGQTLGVEFDRDGDIAPVAHLAFHQFADLGILEVPGCRRQTNGDLVRLESQEVIELRPFLLAVVVVGNGTNHPEHDGNRDDDDDDHHRGNGNLGRSHDFISALACAAP